MRSFVSFIALAALFAPTLAAAQIAEVDLPPSDVADAGESYAQDADDIRAAGDDVRYGTDDDASDASDRVADMLADPDRQDDIADAMTDMMRALMTIRVGPILDAARTVDPAAVAEYGAVDPDATIGDIASHGDPDYEDRIEDGIRDGTAISGTMVRNFARMMPTLIAIAKDIGAQAEKAIDRERR